MTARGPDGRRTKGVLTLLVAGSIASGAARLPSSGGVVSAEAAPAAARAASHIAARPAATAGVLDTPEDRRVGRSAILAGSASGGFIEVPWDDPDWVVATSDKILRDDVCVSPCQEHPNAWYDRVEGPACSSLTHYWKLPEGVSSVTVCPLAPLGQGTFDGMFVREGAAVGVLTSDCSPDAPDLVAGPRFFTLTHWQSRACDGFDPNTTFLPGAAGALASYGAVIQRTSPCAHAPFCGDGRKDPAEACDDGNAAADDGCTNACTVGTSDYALLARHQPLLRIAVGEPFRPIAAASFVQHDRSYLFRDDGEIAPVTIDAVAPRYPDGFVAQDSDYLGLDPTASCDVSCIAQQLNASCDARMTYGRVLADPRSGTWLQYWTFFPFRAVGSSADPAQGDWRFIQVHLPPGSDVPDKMLLARDRDPAACAWGGIQKVDQRPVLFVDEGTHDMRVRRPSGVLVTLSLGLEMIPDRVPDWLQWPGHWGETDSDEYESPPGPAFADAGEPWSDPSSLDVGPCD
jgi:cysteine-rich repeat protein